MSKPKFYHATPIENWQKIQNEGLNPGMDGGVHLTTNKDKALAFIAMRPGIKTVTLFVVDVAEDQVRLFYDGAMSGDDCYIFTGAIESSKIKYVNNYDVKPNRA